MARFMVTPEMKGWLTTNWPKLSLQALILSFNQRFDLEKTEVQVKGILKNHKIKSNRNKGQIRKGQYQSYTNEQADFIRDGYPKWTIPELTAKFNARFNAEKTESQIRCFTRNHGIKSGRTGQFHKGHVPFNTGTKGIMKANSGTFKKGNEPVNSQPLEVRDSVVLLAKIDATCSKRLPQ